MLDAASEQLVRDWLRRGQGGMAWLTGSPGSGMTSMVRELVADMEAVWMTPTTMRSRAFLKDMCRSAVAVNGKRKVLVMDELDTVLSSETAVADVAHAVKQCQRVPMVCVLRATRAAQMCSLHKKAALVVRFPPPTHEATVAAVLRVAEEEGLPTGEVDALCRQAPGDVRHVLQTLRAGVRTTRDVHMPTALGVEAALGRRMGVEEALRIYAADAGALPSGVFEAYWRTTQDIHQCVAYLDMASAGDVVDERIHARQRWDLMDLHGALTVGAAAVTLPRAQGIAPDKHGTLWNKGNLLRTHLKGLKAVETRRAAAGLTRLGGEDLGYVRCMIADCLPDVKAAAAVCRRAGLDADACLAVMRLWDTGYKLTTHAKIKKLLA